MFVGLFDWKRVVSGLVGLQDKVNHFWGHCCYQKYGKNQVWIFTRVPRKIICWGFTEWMRPLKWCPKKLQIFSKKMTKSSEEMILMEDSNNILTFRTWSIISRSKMETSNFWCSLSQQALQNIGLKFFGQISNFHLFISGHQNGAWQMEEQGTWGHKNVSPHVPICHMTPCALCAQTRFLGCRLPEFVQKSSKLHRVLGWF